MTDTKRLKSTNNVIITNTHLRLFIFTTVELQITTNTDFQMLLTEALIWFGVWYFHSIYIPPWQHLFHFHCALLRDSATEQTSSTSLVSESDLGHAALTLRRGAPRAPHSPGARWWWCHRSWPLLISRGVAVLDHLTLLRLLLHKKRVFRNIKHPVTNQAVVSKRKDSPEG